MASANSPPVQAASQSIFSVNSIKKGAQSNMGILVIASIMVMVLIYVILYVYRKYNETSLKTVTVLKLPLQVTKSKFSNVSNDTLLPELYNGKEFSYSFWIYVDNENFERTSDPKFVLGRMSAEDSFGDANPVFYIDPLDNKLHVFVRTDNIASGLNTLAEIHAYTNPPQSNSAMQSDNKQNILTLNYLPLQRWVNIILVVDNNFVQLFVDGDLREVKDLSSGVDNRVVTTSAGNLFTGGSGRTLAFDGYLSKVQAFNYAVTIDHAKIIYKAGPLHKSMLSMLGIPYYGLRSPVYRIDEVTTAVTEDDA